MRERQAPGNFVELGPRGGARLKEYLDQVAKGKGMSLSHLVGGAYTSTPRPYETVRRWFEKESPRVRIDLLEAVLRCAGCRTLLDYPHLPESERARLSNREAPAGLAGGVREVCDVVDLTHDIKQQPSCGFMPDARGIEVEQEIGESGGIHFTTTHITRLPTNYGTHIDFPGHLAGPTKKATVSEFDLRRFVLDAVLVDAREFLNPEIFRRLDPNNRLSPDVFGTGIQGIRKLFQEISRMEISKDWFVSQCYTPLGGKAVLFCTGLDRYWQHSTQPSWRYAYFLNPFLSAELADYLVQEKVLLVGSDTLQLECPLFNVDPAVDFPASEEIRPLLDRFLRPYSARLVHEIFFEKDVCLLENLRGLTPILPGPATLIAAPLRFAHPLMIDNSPTRALALVPKSL